MNISNDIPIIIPFKEQSIRCPNKNFVLFSFVYKYLSIANIGLPIFVVSKSQKVKSFIEKLKLRNIKFLEENEHSTNDITAAYYAAKELNVNQYIHLSLVQPIRDYELIKKIVEYKNDAYDFITTYQLITDRSIFYIDDNNNFINKSYERKGVLCQKQKMIDGSVYLINTKFIDRIINDDDVNASFWNGKFKAVENNIRFFVHVDDKISMDKFYILSKIFLPKY